MPLQHEPLRPRPWLLPHAPPTPRPERTPSHEYGVGGSVLGSRSVLSFIRSLMFISVESQGSIPSARVTMTCSHYLPPPKGGVKVDFQHQLTAHVHSASMRARRPAEAGITERLDDFALQREKKD